MSLKVHAWAMGLAAAALLAAPAAALDRWVTIHNETGYDIVTFHGSHIGTDSWQEDILGNRILPAGQSIKINFNDGTGYCVFDFRAEFNDGDVLIKEDVNVCEIGNFYYQ